LRCGQAVTCAELAIVRCHLTVGGRLGAVLGGLGAVLGGLGAVARGALAKRAGADDDHRAGDRAVRHGLLAVARGLTPHVATERVCGPASSLAYWSQSEAA